MLALSSKYCFYMGDIKFPLAKVHGTIRQRKAQYISPTVLLKYFGNFMNVPSIHFKKLGFKFNSWMNEETR